MRVLQLVNAINIQKHSWSGDIYGATFTRNRQSTAIVVACYSQRRVETSTTRLGWVSSGPYEY